MNEALFSPFRLGDTQLLELHMKVNPKQVQEERGDEELGISSHYIHIDHETEGEGCQFNLIIEFRVYPEVRKARTKPLLSILCEIRALVFATFSDNISSDEKELQLSSNALSILYGEVRTHVAAITSLSPYGRVLLPTINPIEYVRHAMASRYIESADSD